MDEPLKVEKTLTINRSPAELYQFWHNFENLPQFMKHLQNVQVKDQRRSHWKTKAPLNQTVEWDADITAERENEFISWASVPGADIANSGSIEFRPLSHDRGTEVKVISEYHLPLGGLGNAIAKIFGESPEQQIGDDLRRFKMLMETGEIATTEGQPQGKS